MTRAPTTIGLARHQQIVAEARDSAVQMTNNLRALKASADSRAISWQTTAKVAGEVVSFVHRVRVQYDRVPNFVKGFLPSALRTLLTEAFAAAEAYDREIGRREQDFARVQSQLAAAAENLGNIPGPLMIEVGGPRGSGKTTIVNYLKSVLPDALPVSFYEETLSAAAPTLRNATPVGSQPAGSIRNPVRDAE